MSHFKPTKLGVTNALIFFIISLLAFIVSVNMFDSSKADEITTQALQTIDLASPTPFTILGANEDDNLGGSGSQNTFTNLTRARPLATGDFNKDGIQDIAIGAPNADFTPPGVGSTNRPNTGAVYIIFGRSSFTSATVIDTNVAATSQPDIKIYGAVSNDNVGFSLAVADINDDTTEDLLIGAPGVDFGSPSRADTGAVYVMLGSSTLAAKTIDLSVANAINIAIYGEKAGDKFGTSVAAGSFGGAAAAPDILVGAVGSKGPANDRTDAGAAYFLYGGAALTPNPANTTRVQDLAVLKANGTIYGANGSLLGSSVAVGNVNATSPGDLILGAPKANRPVGTGSTAADDTGAVFIVYGGDNLNPTAPATEKIIDLAVTGQSVAIYGANTGDHLGVSVAAGDVTGDGIADIAIGAPDADGFQEARLESGEAYVIAGSAALPARINVSLTSVTLTVFGESVNAHTGSTVAIGRLNTDGNIDTNAELLVGSPGALSNKGSVSAFFGGASLTALQSRDIFLGQDDLRVLGQATDDELGWAIAAGDVDGNRGGDLILSAPFAAPSTPARLEAGEVYVVLAANDDVPPLSQPPVVQVTLPNGGETLVGGSIFNITWTASDPNGDDSIQAFEIRLSIDGGANFNTIIASNISGTARMFAWTVNGGINTASARIRVIATDNTGATGQDDSNANFSITDPGIAVHLLAPNGGESIIAGQTFRITWEVPVVSEAQVRGFDLFLSTDAGATFTRSIQSDPVNPKLGPTVRFFDWVVPADIGCTTTARVLVVATSITGARSTDTSDANFSTVGPGPSINTAEIALDETLSRLVLRTIPPPIGTEILFSQNAVLEISTTEAGTTFVTFSKPFKFKKGGKVVITKGTINNQDLNLFFPDGATRILRVTNPPCGVTVLRIRRQGAVFVIAPPPGL
jgi:hypothetical protein